MRKVNQKVAALIRGHKSGKASANTEVVQGAIGSGNAYADVYLFGKHIAKYWYSNDAIVVNERTLAEWPTATTADRINGLLRSFNRDQYVRRHKGVLYFGTRHADGTRDESSY
jgi:hypothetical protein